MGLREFTVSIKNSLDPESNSARNNLEIPTKNRQEVKSVFLFEKAFFKPLL